MDDGKAFLPEASLHLPEANLPLMPSSARLSAKATRWIEENRAAIDEYNEWYAKNGSPLDRFRSF